MTQVFQNVLPDHIRLSALAGFPDVHWPHWHRYANGKMATVDEARIPPGCRFALQKLAETITPPDGAFWDLSLHGAGLHLMPVGSSLGKHVDAERHPLHSWRRVASLVYWLEDCKGGELVAEDNTILPTSNIAAVLQSDEVHEVLQCKSPRRTLSLFAWQICSGRGTTQATFFENTGPS